MEQTGLFSVVVVGLLAGWIAQRVLNRHAGIFADLVVGVSGAFVGVWIAEALGITLEGVLGMLVVAVVGAVLLLALAGIVRPRP